MAKGNIHTAREIAQNGMNLVRENKIRNHKLRNSARIHTGEMERQEVRLFRDFLPGKNGCMIYELVGSDKYE